MIEEKLNIKFDDKSLITRALTHPSKSKDNYQRLEYLGDCIIDFVVGEYLFKNTDKPEGELTVLRSHFVAEVYLAQCFDSLDLESEVIYAKSLKSITQSIKCDIFEAIVGAIYMDKGLSLTKKFIIKTLKLKDYGDFVDDNYKSQLQELVQANFVCEREYKTKAIEGNMFQADFVMDGDVIATGYGKSKQIAEQNCARVAISKLFVDEE